MTTEHPDRKKLKKMLKRKLLSMGSPRLQMLLILSFTGLAGFLTSFALLKLGLTQMNLRYPLSVLASYGFFFLSLHIWTRYILAQAKFRMELLKDYGGSNELIRSGGKKKDRNKPQGSSLDAGSGDIGSLDFDGEALLILAALAMFFSVLYLVYLAPVILAEVLLEAILLTGLYSRLRNLRAENWAYGVFARTWYLFLIIAVLLLLAGWALQYENPGIVSLGDFFRERFGK